MFMQKYFLMGVFCLFLTSVCWAGTLSGTVSVNITSDTAATAKNMAFDEARRQIISDILSQYSNADQLNEVLKNSSSTDLTNLVASSSIDGEKQSDTTYSANITMDIDRAVAKQWLTNNNVQNWLPDDVSGDVFVVQVVMSDKVANWMELKQIARSEGIDLATKYINGNQVTVEVPVSNRSNFTIAIGENGWRYYDQDGVLRIWK